MPDQDVIRIFKSITKLKDDEILKLSNTKAWQEIYKAEAEERERKEELRKPEICFTGFNFEEREKFETEATIKGLKVRSRVTKFLAYLVIGDLPGEKKIEQAEEQGVQILTIDEYEKLDTFTKKPKSISKKTKKVTTQEDEYVDEYVDESIGQTKKSIPNWVWFILGIVIVFVIASL